MQLSRGKGTQIVRLEVPDLSEGDASKKRPVLIALHGAGGSENMFFETYGAGRLVSLSRERGWIVVSPRQSMLGFGGGGLGLDVRSILEVLETVLPIDRERVFLVGHSMGAAQAIAQVSKSPEEIRGVAALGGGGSVRDSAPLRRIPFWVGAGDRDFGKAGAKGLSQQLKRLGCEATYREYADVEHMVIVQAALDDVFAFFDSKLN